MIDEFKVKAKELLNKIEELVHEGNIRRIIIKDARGKTYIEIPVTIGVVGTLCAPIFASVGALAGYAANFTVEVVRRDENENSEPSGIINEEDILS